MADNRYSLEDRLGMLKIDMEQDRKDTRATYAGLEARLERLEAGQARMLSALTPLASRLQATVEGLRDEASDLATDEQSFVDAATPVPAASALDLACQSTDHADPTVSVNLKLSRAGAEAISAAAIAQGTTQKVVITRALIMAGVPLPARDLEDRTPRRRYQD